MCIGNTDYKSFCDVFVRTNPVGIGGCIGVMTILIHLQDAVGCFNVRERACLIRIGVLCHYLTFKFLLVILSAIR